MSYIKQNFTSGQVLNADHLNHIEDGIAAIKIPTKVSELINDSGYLTEFTAAEGIPGYVFDEAERVVKTVQSKQSPYTLTFIAASDPHYSKIANATQFYSSIQHMGQAMKVMKDSIFIDFIALLGDYCWDSSETTEESLTAIREFNRLIGDASSGITKIRAKGNHDNLNSSGKNSQSTPGYLTNDQVFSNIGIFNRGAVFDSNNPSGSYCYRDYDDLKLRIICLNSSDDDGLDDSSDSDTINNNYGEAIITATQINWLSSTLSSIPSGWGAILLSHHPLDWPELTNKTDQLLTLLKNNESKIYCAFNGHVHCHNMGYISGTQIPRIAIPNACFQRNNEYGNNGGNYTHGVYPSNTMYKISNTKDDTSFSVVTIDTLNQLIYIDNYGAGFDRIINYKNGSIENYTISYDFTKITSTNTSTNINATQPYYTTLTPEANLTIDSLQVIMGEEDITSQVQISKNKISIPSVTGNIIIKASTAAGTFGQSNLRLFAQESSSTNIFNNGLGYRNNSRLSSSGSDYIQTNVDYPYVATGYIPYSRTNNAYSSITIDGAKWEDYSGECRLYFFKADKTVKTSALINSSALLSQYFTVSQESNLRFTLIPTSKLNNITDIAFFRISLNGFGDNLNIYTGDVTEDNSGKEYTVTYNCINCSVSDNAPSIVTHGSFFSVLVQANTGYGIATENIVATMEGGGSLILDSGIPYSIWTSSVTGNISITVTAIKMSNLSTFAQEATSTSIFNGGLGYKDNTYLSYPTDGTLDGYFVTGYIPYEYDDNLGAYPPLHIVGINFDLSQGGYTRLYGYGEKETEPQIWGATRHFTISQPNPDKDWLLDPANNASWTKGRVKYIRLSAPGLGNDCNIYFEKP